MANKETNFVSAVIYVHNAEDRIVSFLKTVIGVMEENFEHSEIICVNDSSEDNSLDLIKKTSELSSTTGISVVNMSCFHGLELAMNAGIDMAIGDFIFEFDNTYPDFEPSVVMDIYKKALNGYDIVSASPDRKEKFMSKMFYKILEHYINPSYSLSAESFRVLSRRVLNRINSMNKAVPYRKVAYANCGLKTDNIRYRVVNRIPTSEDKQEKSFRSKLAVDSLILFTGIGYAFAKTLTVLMLCISVFTTVCSAVIYITSDTLPCWTATVLFLSVAFFGLFGILTIIVRYLQLLVGLVFKRKQYSFESIEKLTK